MGRVCGVGGGGGGFSGFNIGVRHAANVGSTPRCDMDLIPTVNFQCRPLHDVRQYIQPPRAVVKKKSAVLFPMKGFQ